MTVDPTPEQVTEALAWLRENPETLDWLDAAGFSGEYIATVVRAALARDVPAGRDLTAQDVRDTQETWSGGTAEEYRQFAAEFLNRIARPARDVPAPGDEPPVHLGYVERPALTLCPTCESSQPHLHPTPDLCPDPFHEPVPASPTEWRREVARWADLLDSWSLMDHSGDRRPVHRIVAEMRREVGASATVSDRAGTAPTDGPRVPDDVARRWRRERDEAREMVRHLRAGGGDTAGQDEPLEGQALVDALVAAGWTRTGGRAGLYVRLKRDVPVSNTALVPLDRSASDYADLLSFAREEIGIVLAAPAVDTAAPLPGYGAGWDAGYAAGVANTAGQDEPDDMFASTCTECLDPLDDDHPYGTNADGDFVHYACSDEDAASAVDTAGQDESPQFAPDGQPYDDEQPTTWAELVDEFAEQADATDERMRERDRTGERQDLYALGRSSGHRDAAERIRYLIPRLTAAPAVDTAAPLAAVADLAREAIREREVVNRPGTTASGDEIWEVAGAAGLAESILAALAVDTTGPDPLTWPGVASAGGTYDRIVDKVTQSWARHRELHYPNVDENTEALIEHAVHITISTLQRDPSIAPTERAAPDPLRDAGDELAAAARSLAKEELSGEDAVDAEQRVLRAVQRWEATRGGQAPAQPDQQDGDA